MRLAATDPLGKLRSYSCYKRGEGRKGKERVWNIEGRKGRKEKDVNGKGGIGRARRVRKGTQQKGKGE